MIWILDILEKNNEYRRSEYMKKSEIFLFKNLSFTIYEKADHYVNARINVEKELVFFTGDILSVFDIC